jgi:hypothetical protein
MVPDNWITGAHIADIVLVAMLLEAAALGLLKWRTGRGPAWLPHLASLAAGACLVMALRCVLAGAGVGCAAAFLALGLVAHLIDVSLRWRSGK